MSDALTKAEDIRQTIEELCPEGLKITARLGVAEIQVDFTALFKAADEAVYKAKSGAKQNYRTSI